MDTTIAKVFTADMFVATAHSSALEKAKFANQYVKFVLGGCRREDFPKWFYTRLSMCFGHIAHYNQDGFYSTWFTTSENRHRFVEHAEEYMCPGSPEYTYSDVERALVEWLRTSNIVLEFHNERIKEMWKEKLELYHVLRRELMQVGLIGKED